MVTFHFHHNAVPLVSTVTLVHVLVEEQSTVSNPSQDHAHRKVKQGHYSLPHLEVWALHNLHIYHDAGLDHKLNDI